MKINWNYIKAFALLILVVFLYSFSAKRHATRNLKSVEVAFTNGENLYITENAVNKLLIVNPDSVQNVSKEILVLNKLESVLDNHDMIEDAEVYLTVDGSLGTLITQRKPIARVANKKHFYIDTNGKKMPLSANYSARVPWVSNISEKEIAEIFPLLKKIEKDEFLTKHITAIDRLENGDYKLQLRTLDFEVLFGKISAIERKVDNFKAFYKKAYIDKKLDAYTSVNLQFENQVVCTKK
ncbi:cell division protein FtsQ/DivIB [Mesonia maritima]|uniref:Cell division protein FtsQ n=1 Tax=Mesonia maritima TaxID=1793873 RepID=A0ABU1KBW6_9FLAO|nr:hypothetical protein [Mesonia maritima]MDR6302068.1 cell division protein FtsQ [Mesonia maritima]